MMRLGLLTPFGVGPFAAYCQAYGRWAQAERLLAHLMEQDPSGRSAMLLKARTGAIYPNSLVWIARSAAAGMVRHAAEFGFSPSARARVQAASLPIPDRPGGKFEGLLGPLRR
jgi:phage terminase small subunit